MPRKSVKLESQPKELNQGEKSLVPLRKEPIFEINSNKNVCILVLGIHRSRTSMVTGLLNKLGLSAGSELLSPAKDNPVGFYENKKVTALSNINTC